MVMDYPTLKGIHLSAVALSLGGFVVRAPAAILEAVWVRHRIMRVLPHLIDTVLLTSAIGLAWMAGLNPLQTPWLLTKILALLIYIALGSLAVKPGRPKFLRWSALLLALGVATHIVSVALTKSPWGWLTGIIGA